MSKISSEIEMLLKKQSDLAYANFHSRLMPNIDKSLIIGVRTPKVRELAKQLKNHPNIKEFLRDLPHKYYEQNNLHAFIIEQIANYDNCVRIPMKSTVRSLNLSNSVAIILYEALRQHDYIQLKREGSIPEHN